MFDPAIDTATEQESEKNQVREFLSRAEIRTMRKDLQKLREAVAMKERERIVNLKASGPGPAKNNGQKQAEPKAPERNLNQNQSLENTKIFQQKKDEEKKAMEEIKTYTQESEKQQILYYEEQKLDLAKNLETLEKQKEPPLLLEKNRLALKRDEIQKRLNGLLGEEKKVEDEEKLVSESEKSSTLPSDRQKLEKKRWSVEEKRQEAEKKNWAVEKELETTENQLKAVEGECQKIVEEKNELKNKIAEIDASLRSVYTGVMGREQERISSEKERRDVESLKRAAIETRQKESIIEQQWAGREETSSLSFLNKMPEGERKERLKERIQGTANEEGEQRRKFLENVEKWSEERGKNPDGADNPPAAPKPTRDPNKN